MTLIWLLVWLIKGTPALHEWNAWLVSLIIMLAFDFLGGGSKANRR